MKQNIFKKLMLIALLLTSNAIWAYDFESGGIYYNITSSENKTVEVTYSDTNYNSYSGDVTIPNSVTHEGTEYSITSIGSRTFYKCTGLTSITITNSITSIGREAFMYCSGLTSVTIPNSVTIIREWTFRYCSSLTSVTIPNSVTSIGNYTFNDCTGLTSITIPEGVTSIDEGAFSDCSGLTSIAIPNSVTDIGSKTFQKCSGLTSVTIPEGVTSIGSDAFKYCTGLTNVTFESTTPPSIGQDAFFNASPTIKTPFASILAYKALEALKYMTFASHKVEGFYYLPTSDNEVEVTSNPSKYSGDIVIPAEITVDDIKYNVTSIRDYAFENCTGLTNVTIPNSVTSIGYNAFYDCTGLTSVSIPNSVTSIRDYAFYNCTGLTNVTFESTTPPSIGLYAFYNASPTIKTPFASILNYKAIEQLKNKTFAGHKVEGIYYMPTSDTEVEVTYKDNNYNSYIGEVIIPTEITVDDIKYNVTSIGNSAFQNCSSLTSVTIPNSVTSIGNFAFFNCTRLTNVTFESTTPPSIGLYAFDNASPTIKTPFASILAYKALEALKYKTFANHKVEGIYYLPTSETEVEVTFKDKNYNSYIGEVIIPTEITVDDIKYNVTSIRDYAFYDCTGLTSVTIPNSVTSIGNYAFYDCN